MAKTKFGKKYFGGSLRTLIAMIGFDASVKEFQKKDWEQIETKKVDGKDVQYVTGYSVVL